MCPRYEATAALPKNGNDEMIGLLAPAAETSPLNHNLSGKRLGRGGGGGGGGGMKPHASPAVRRAPPGRMSPGAEPQPKPQGGSDAQHLHARHRGGPHHAMAGGEVPLRDTAYDAGHMDLGDEMSMDTLRADTFDAL